VLRVEDDPFGLDDFFDCPKPLMMASGYERLEPAPDYRMYRVLAEKVERLMQRIHSLLSAVKVTGWTDSTLATIGLGDQNDGEYVPIDNIAELLERSGVKEVGALIHHFPVNDYIVVLQQLREHVMFLKQQSYEINGISDIVRGATRASETATAQSLKGQWQNIRLVQKKNALDAFVRHLFRLMAEMIAEQFDAQILAEMTATPIEEVQQAQALLQNEIRRGFQIDVESDSTIAKDEMEDRRSRQEMIQALSQLLAQLIPGVIQGTVNVELAKQLMLLAIRGYPHARDLEDYILAMDQTVQQFQQFQQQLQQMQQQLQQSGQAVQERDQAIQQRDQQLQQLSQRLQQVQQQHLKANHDVAMMEAQAKLQKSGADSEESMAAIRKMGGELQKLIAETQQIYQEMSYAGVVAPGQRAVHQMGGLPAGE